MTTCTTAGTMRDMPTDDEHLAKYLEVTQAVPPLPRDEENRLLASIRSGDEGAKKRLVEAYLNLTAQLGLRLAPTWLRRIDAIQYANLELIRLLEDPSSEPMPVVLAQAIHARFEQLEDPGSGA